MSPGDRRESHDRHDGLFFSLFVVLRLSWSVSVLHVQQLVFH